MSYPKEVPKEVSREAKDEVSEKYLFRLFVAGAKPQSSRAIINLRKICDQYLTGRYQIEVIDIYQYPNLAVDEEILAIPTLVKDQPGIKQRWIGDLSNEGCILNSLGIKSVRENQADD